MIVRCGMLISLKEDKYSFTIHLQIRVHDTAFIDYMRDKAIAHPKIWINPTVHNCTMASQLLRFLNERLRYISNLSEFDEVHDKTFEVLEYRNDSKHKKLNRAVVYASRFWMYHISESELTPNRYLDPQELKKWAKNQVQVIQQLKEFFQHGRLLSWVVVLDCSGVIEEVRLQWKKVKLWLAVRILCISLVNISWPLYIESAIKHHN